MNTCAIPTEYEVRQRMRALHSRRVDEINAYWQLCRTSPAKAMEEAITRGAPVMMDVCLLAQNVTRPTWRIRPDLLDQVKERIARELDWNEDEQDKHDWEPAKLVGVFRRNGKTLFVHRFSMGPFYHDEHDGVDNLEGDVWYLQSATFEPEGEATYSEVRAYLVGDLNDKDEWVPVAVSAPELIELQRLVMWTVRLARSNKVPLDMFGDSPFPEFPCAVDAELVNLTAEHTRLYSAGKRSPEEQERVAQATAELTGKLEALRKQEWEISQQIRAVREQLFEKQAALLEEELGIKRGDVIEHKVSGRTGVVTICQNGSDAEVRLESDFHNITPELRRREWVVISRVTL